MSHMFPGRHFSFVRLAIAVLTVAAVAFGSWAWLGYTRTSSTPLPESWFGGYVDVTATPSYAFESDVGSPYDNVILGFITAKDDRCVPSWGGYYTLDEAATTLDLNNRIAQARRAGRSIVISFGGQKGTELAHACSSADQLEAAYAKVIDQYRVNAIEFDLEGNDLDADTTVQANRVTAIRRLIDRYADTSTALNVALTVPIGQSGMTRDTLDMVNSLLDAGITISKLNLMAMDYGIPSSNTTQSDIITKTLHIAHDQYRQLLYLHGHLFDDTQVWQLLGATVLIGRNDTTGEYLSTDDAQQVNTFALETTLGRLSMWSLNRDRQCDSNVGDIGTILPFCSGMRQSDGQFAATLAAGFRGRPSQSLSFESTSGSADPSTPPYPQWSAETTYRTGDKVVWESNIFQATQGNTGVEPTQASSGTNSPWRIIGPII